MPNTREKPIEQKLKNGAESICDKCFHGKVCRAIDNQPCIECNQFTDANGVTVQEWISVNDRLPERKGNYLGFTGSTTMVGYYKGNGIWWIWLNDVEGENLFTHWIPLPQPPKGE